MTPLNKVVMTRLHHTPLLAISGQMLGATTILGCIPSVYNTPWQDLFKMLVLPPIFVAMLTTSMLSLHYASIGAIMAIRNCAPLLAFPLEHMWIEPQRVDAQTILALVCVAFGCIGFVMRDMHTSPVGALLATMNMTFSVVDRLVQRHLLASVQVSKTALLLVNNSIGGLIVLSIATVVLHERPSRVGRDPETLAPWGGSVIVGLLFGYSGVWAQSHVSATTHLVLSNLNRMVVLCISALFIGESFTWETGLCALASLFGTVLFSVSVRPRRDALK